MLHIPLVFQKTILFLFNVELTCLLEETEENRPVR